jgi:hypothetical protein
MSNPKIWQNLPEIWLDFFPTQNLLIPKTSTSLNSKKSNQSKKLTLVFYKNNFSRLKN